MNTGRQTRCIKGWGFKSKSQYENYVTEKIEDLEFIGHQLLRIFQDRTKEWELDYLKNKTKRFVAETISPPGRPTKDPKRVVDKILDSWERYAQWEKKTEGKRGKVKPPTRHDPKEFLRTMTDLIRFRIVCNYLSDLRYIEKRILDDVHYIEEKIRGFDKKCRKLKVKKNDYIETPFPERRVGHRALQYVFKYSGEKSPILFEIQVMTQLQHAWDKKDHHLIYEYERDGRGDKIPLHLKNRMAAMSEVLYVADTVFDALRDDITEIVEKDKA